MPKGFENCVKKGGRVRRIVPKKGVYLNVCWLNGKSYRGEVHHTKTKKKKGVCPGSKIKSRGRGRGLGTGKGQGPIGRRKKTKAYVTKRLLRG